MTRFTGRHMALVMAGFFGTVIAVNTAMAVLASSSATGLVAKNGYVASIDVARDRKNHAAAAALGWTVAVTQHAGRVGVAVTDAAGPVAAAMTGTAEHPAGGDAVPLDLADGVATAVLEPGDWIVRLHLAAAGQTLDWRAPLVVPR